MVSCGFLVLDSSFLFVKDTPSFSAPDGMSRGQGKLLLLLSHECFRDSFLGLGGRAKGPTKHIVSTSFDFSNPIVIPRGRKGRGADLTFRIGLGNGDFDFRVY